MTRSPDRPRTRAAIACGALVVLLVPVIVAAVARGDAAGSPRAVTWTGRTMGTYVRVTIATADSAAAAANAEPALAVFRRVDSLMSNWTTTSEVARLNREAAAAPVTVHPEVATVLEASLRIGLASDGAFDITVEPLIRAWGFIGGPRRVPSPAEIQAALAHVGLRWIQYEPARRRLELDHEGVKIDLGGIAKGYAVDVAAESLKARGVKDALVDLSGNMVALGRSPTAAASGGWRIGIRDPRDRIPYVARLTIHDEAISTSGQYEQFVAADGTTYGHIVDPRTGQPSRGLISVTVVSPTAMQCDGWDTPLFVMGPDKARRQARALDRLAAVLIEPGTGSVDTMWVEETLRDRLVLEPAARPFIHIRYF